jgi:hypothetical protein
MFAHRITRIAAAALFAASLLHIAAAPAAARAPETLSRISGLAFLDANANGVRDPGEGEAFGWYKVTNGGNYFSCGYTGKGGTFGVPVKTGVFYVMPIAIKGFHTTTPIIKVDVKDIGKDVRIDMGFAPSFNAPGDPCSAYLPKRVIRSNGLGIVETATANGRFNTLLAAADRAGLLDTLLTGGPFTIFAPNDSAFSKFTDEELAAVLADKAALTDLLRSHIMSGKVSANDVLNGAELKTLSGKVLTAELKDDVATINGAELLATDIDTANGVIHVIDTVIR